MSGDERPTLLTGTFKDADEVREPIGCMVGQMQGADRPPIFTPEGNDGDGVVPLQDTAAPDLAQSFRGELLFDGLQLAPHEASALGEEGEPRIARTHRGEGSTRSAGIAGSGSLGVWSGSSRCWAIGIGRSVRPHGRVREAASG